MASFDSSDEKVKELLNAASSGRLHPFKVLAKELDKGKGIAETIKAVKDANGRGSIHLAAAQGNTQICHYLIEELKIEVDFRSEKGETPLFHAAMGGHVATTKYLISLGAVIVAADNEGFSPLHCAAKHGKHEIVELLLFLQVPVDLEYACVETGTPLTLAAIHGQAKTMEVLLKHNANVDKEASNMYTPLMSSVYAGSVKCTRLLIEAGADLNLKCPLEIAIRCDSVEILMCLLKAGADPNVCSENGLLPIEIAAVHGRREIMEILFPLTAPVLEVQNWSVSGILQHVKSDTFQNEARKKEEARYAELKAKGQDAFRKKDYPEAIRIYSATIKIDSKDATVFSNRSLCWHRMGAGGRALVDAQMALSLRPDWPKAYYRVGSAFMLLRDYDQASKAFFDGLKLGNNEEIFDAFWYAEDCKDRSKRGLEILSHCKFSEPVDVGNFFHLPPSYSCCLLGDHSEIDHVEFGYEIADDLEIFE